MLPTDSLHTLDLLMANNPHINDLLPPHYSSNIVLLYHKYTISPIKMKKVTLTLFCDQ